MKSIYRFKEVIKRRGENFCLKIPHLEITPAGIYSLIGPNGSGKTTLIQLLAFLEAADSGEIFLNEKPVPNRFCKEIRHQIAYVMQDPVLFKRRVIDFLAYGLKLRRLNIFDLNSRLEKVSRLFDLTHCLKRGIQELSYGEKKRVAIAAAFALETPVLIMDEPFANLDGHSRQIIENMILTAEKKGQQLILFSTHELQWAYRCGAHILSLFQGGLIEAVLENFYPCDLLKAPEGSVARISPALEFKVVSPLRDKAFVNIGPAEIILSRTKVQTSARNQFQGKIQRIEVEKNRVRLWVDISVPVIVQITQEAYKEMSLAIDDSVFLFFKASAVQVFQ